MIQLHFVKQLLALFPSCLQNVYYRRNGFLLCSLKIRGKGILSDVSANDCRKKMTGYKKKVFQYCQKQNNEDLIKNSERF
jgi:hypothetical protein